jgi:uncharacterized protein
MIIDAHMVLGSGKAWWDQVGTSSSSSTPPPPLREVNFEPTQVLEECARAGIDRACVVSPLNDTYEAANRYVADACAKHPKKLIGIAVHSPQREEGKLRQLLTNEVRSMGMKAVRSDGPPSRELLDIARELGIPVIYSPVLAPMQGPVRLFHMMTEYYPEVNFILPHMGRFSPDYSIAMEVPDFVARQKNMYFDTSATMYVKYLERAAKMVPIERILFGSCGPHLDARVAIETVRILELPKDKHEKVMGGNIAKILKL